MMVEKLTVCCLLALVSIPSFAGLKKDSLHTDSRYFYKELNYLENLYLYTQNPVRLSKNRVKTIADANLGTTFSKGDYHAIDVGRKSRKLGINLSGLKTFGRLDVYGHIDYINGKEYDHRWNSTLFVTDTNPFILGDSIKSDVNTEIFNMSAAASYQFNNRFIGALSLGYKTGCFSDQTDPRPKTDAMHFKMNPGFEYLLNDAHSIGLSGMVDIFRSDLTHSVINNNNNYSYYLMKGMGDFMVVTSNDMGSYPRDYKGLRYGGALQWYFTPTNSSFRNLLEVSFMTNKEEAEDGGYAFTFKGGDYTRKDIKVYNRFNIRKGSRFQQNITFIGVYTSDNGDWYDQKKLVDSEHGNLPYYKILNKSKISESVFVNTKVSYQADFLRQNLPNLSLMADLAFSRTDIKYYSTAKFNQCVNMLQVSAGARKHLLLGKVRLSGVAQGFYATPLGNPIYATANSKISRSYTAPAFEYISSAHVGFKVEANVSLPIDLYGYTTWMGFKFRLDSSFYQGNSTYSKVLESTSRTVANVAFNIKF